MYIYELKIIFNENGKKDTGRVAFFASVDAAYNFLTGIGVPIILGQDDRRKKTIKNAMLAIDTIHVVVPAHTDEETGIFVDEYANDYVMYTHYVNE